jgi:transposase
MSKEVNRLRAFNNELKQKSFYIGEQLINVKNKLYGKSSEREPSKEDRKKVKAANKGKKVLLPSLRYPDAPLIERRIELDRLPQCKCCNNQMKDSGMTENSEVLTSIPAQHLVIRLMRAIYRCEECHGALLTAPCEARINESGSYSDEMIVDVALSKYCDLIPIERYTEIAARNGLENLPPNSLIDQTHVLADFVEKASDKVKDEVMGSRVISADETPHRMLEGSDKSNWHLWGFSTSSASYFEIRDTRSGDVASELLRKSNCEYLISDVYSGYAKAVRETNEERKKLELPSILNIYCNAHARRKFKDSEENFGELSQFFIEQYSKIYRLEKFAKGRPPNRVLRARGFMAPLFEKMRTRAIETLGGYFTKSSIGKAMTYFLKNYEELTRFITNQDLPIDNNRQESLLRNPVVGRKTWYGTHSIRGAKTAAIMHTLVESCKLIGVNPRKYFPKLIQNIHEGKKILSPFEFKNLSQ